MRKRSNLRLLPAGFRPLDAALTFAGPLFLLLMLEGYSRADFSAAFAWMAREPFLCAVNYGLFLGVCLLLSVIRSDRLRAAVTLLLALLCALMGIANHYKILYRLEPLLFTDVTQLADARATLTGLAFDIDGAAIVRVCVLFAAAIALCCALLKKRQAVRPVLPALFGLALLCWLPFQCTFELANGSVRTDMVDHARNEGSLYAAVAMENHRRALMRLDYDETDVRAQYRELMDQAGARTGAEPVSKRPNIIFVLWESFADEAFLSQYLDLTEPLMPFYQQLEKSGQTGRLYVPKLGGGTSETEFEVLTGLRSKYAINPYSMGLPPINSLASTLRAKGYASTAIHWYSGVYYNRYKNLRMEGFDAFYTTDTTTKAFQRTGMFTSDAEHFRSIMEQLRTSEGRDFVFCLTMQNHGGYAYDDFRKAYGANVPFSNQLSAESELIVSNYCWLLRQSDDALRAFIGELERFDEPVLLVLFGDHIPPFGADVFEELGITAQGDAGHLTPYLIWSNAEALRGQRDMYAYQLGAYALTLAGLNDDPFLSYVERLREGGVEEDARYDLLSYDALFGRQYAYREGGLSPENPSFQIGGRMELTGFDAAEIGDAVYVRPRLAIKDQAYKLCVDGAVRDTCRIQKTGQTLTLQCVMTNSNGTRLNESNSQVYAGTDELLRQSGELAYQATPLWESDYELTRNLWYQNYCVFQSTEPFEAGRSTAATLDGEELQWQPVYGVGKAGQYGVDADGTVCLAVEKSALREYGLTGEGLRAYLKRHRAQLIVFED